jgi:hypothetical protein
MGSSYHILPGEELPERLGVVALDGNQDISPSESNLLGLWTAYKRGFQACNRESFGVPEE